MRYALLAVLVLQACAHQRASQAWENEQGPDEAGSGGTAGLGTTARYVWSRMAPGRFTTSQTYPQFFGERVTGVAIAPGSISTTGTVTALSYTATAGDNVDALILTAGAEIQWGASTAKLSGDSGTTVTAEGDFTVAGTLTATDLRPPGTATFDINAHAASGNGITLDCSVNLGASDFCLKVRDNGTTDLFTVSGTGTATATALTATAAVTGGTLASNDTLSVTGIATLSDDLLAQSTISNTTASQAVTISDAQGLLIVSQTLPTCAAGLEWTLVSDAASGVSTGARSRMCMCTSDGAGTPAYAWQNIVTANIGNTTTCPP